MASKSDLKLEVRISSVKNVEDVSLGDGPLQAYYVVVRAPPNPKSARTKRNLIGITDPTWNEILNIDSVDLDESPTVQIHLHRYNESGDDGPIIGSASFPLMAIIERAGLGNPYNVTRQLRHPLSRFQGTLTVTFVLRYSTCCNPSAPYTYNTKQPLPTASQLTAVVRHPPGTADASWMRDNGHLMCIGLVLYAMAFGLRKMNKN